MEILDRYQGFSSEILRLALLGIAAIGFLVDTAVMGSASASVRLDIPGVRRWFVVALGAFGVAVLAALVHRYYSTDSMASHLRLIGLTDKAKAEVEQAERDRAFSISRWSIMLAPTALAVGACAVAVAFIRALR